MQDIITINGEKIPRGKSAQINIHIDRLPTNTEIILPVFVYRGEKAGKTLLLTAGLHGDEINGIEVLRRMIKKNQLQPKAGTVIAMPIVNIYGFLQNSRALPDGKDLNRSFPGSKKGTLAQRVAYILMNQIIPQIDYGLDFHTGGASIHNYPQIRCTFDSAVNLELAKAFAPPFILNSEYINKSFRKAAFKSKKHLIVFEAGESLRLDDFSIEEGSNGVLRLMKYLKMTDKAPVPNKSKILVNKKWIRAKHGGLFKSFVKAGEMVNVSQQIGYITNPFGDEEFYIRSPYSGYIFGLNHSAVVNAGDALFHLGMTE